MTHPTPQAATGPDTAPETDEQRSRREELTARLRETNARSEQDHQLKSGAAG
jgi:hypothetical protein